jgi:hypothetical protein
LSVEKITAKASAVIEIMRASQNASQGNSARRGLGRRSARHTIKQTLRRIVPRQKRAAEAAPSRAGRTRSPAKPWKIDHPARS